MRYILYLLFFSFSFVHAQTLSSNRLQTPKMLFKISNDQADSIFRKGTSIIDDHFLHTLIDTKNKTEDFNQTYIDSLPIGQYLLTNLKDNYVDFKLISQNNCHAYIYYNAHDLIIQIKDKAGNSINDARVHTKNKKIRFDDESSSYRSKKNIRDQYLRVEHNGIFNYFDLIQNKSTNTWQRLKRRIGHYSLFRWTFSTLSTALFIPIDLLRNIKHVRRSWSANWMRNKYSRIKNKLQYWINHEDAYIRYHGYMNLNKPKFRKRDTVKVAAHIINMYKRPFEKDLDVYLEGKTLNRKYFSKKIGCIPSSKSGLYQFQFVLVDSLNLIIDRRYTIKLKDKNKSSIYSTAFQFEQYEFNDLEVELSQNKDYHFRGEDNKISIKISDINKLPVSGGSIHIKGKAGANVEFLEDEIHIKDIFIDTIIDASVSGETIFNISDELFPEINMNYSINVEYTDWDEKSIFRSISTRFIHKKTLLSQVQEDDSIRIHIRENKDSLTADGLLEITDAFGSRTIPWNSSDWIKPIAAATQIKFKYKEEVHLLSWDYNPIEIIEDIKNNELTWTVKNPYDIPFSYYVYKGNKKIETNHGKSFNFSRKNLNEKTYTVCINYLWNGQANSPCYKAENPDLRKITFEVDHLNKIYPGEALDITIKAKDQAGNPIENLQIMAQAVNEKMSYFPLISPIRQKSKKKYLIEYSSYEIEQAARKAQKELNYPFWQKTAKLDSNLYYKFRYPDSIFIHHIAEIDSITQIAPYVFNNGVRENIQIIYIDHVPVYFDWANKVPYSFKTTSGLHQISIRTSYHSIEIPRVSIKKGVKTFLSIDISKYSHKYHVSHRKDVITKKELRNINNYRIALDRYETNAPSFITNRDSSFIYFVPIGNTHTPIQLGPFRNQNYTYHLSNNFTQEFGIESGYAYSFRNKYLKLKSIDISRNINLRYSTHPFRLDDFAWSKRSMNEYINTFYTNGRKKRFYDTIQNYYSDRSNEKTAILGKLKIKYRDLEIENLFLIPQFRAKKIQIFNKAIPSFPSLEKGQYKMLIILEGDHYQLIDSIEIQANSTNYYNLNSYPVHTDFQNPSFDSLLNKILYQPDSTFINIYRDKELLKEKLYKSYGYFDGFYHLKGKVQEMDGSGVIAAAVLAFDANGTQLKGVTTDFDGNFHLKSIENVSYLEVSYLGFTNQTRKIESDLDFHEEINITLAEEGTVLSEVAIVGYSSELVRFDQTSSVKTVTAEAIANSPLKSISGLAAISAGISIENGNNISIRGARANATNYYVDGIRVTKRKSLNTNDILDIQTITGDQAKSVYGADTVILIQTTNVPIYQNKGTSIRTNFNDEGFWKPNVQTNENGIARFTTTLPDNITSWGIHLTAINEKGQYGQEKSIIQSFKPLSVELSVPRFMIEGDEAIIKSKIQNYQNDTVNISSEFKVDKKLIEKKDQIIEHVLIDSLSINAISKRDSLEILYKLNLGDDYTDGEKRYIPILPKGMLKTEGQFLILEKDTSFQISTAGNQDAEHYLYMESSDIQILRREIRHIHDYKYLCNEQLASKIIALITDKRICKILDEDFEFDQDIKKSIKQLSKRYNKKRLWGWWENDNYDSWVSNHALKSIRMAKEEGYRININIRSSIFKLVTELEFSSTLSRASDLIESIYYIDSTYNFDQFIGHFDTIPPRNLSEEIRYTNTKKELGYDIDLNFLNPFIQKNMIGTSFIKDTLKHKRYSIRNNERINTALAYTLYKESNPSIASAMKRHLMNSRINGYWYNTYESSLFIDILYKNIDFKTTSSNARVKLSGDINEKIDSFPYALQLEANQDIQIDKTGFQTVYFTNYKQYWEKNINHQEDDFIIHTSINELDSTNWAINQGESFIINIEVEAKKDADYVMIEVPIPAGAKYKSKVLGGKPEIHRGYDDEKVSIYCKELEQGKYTFQVKLESRFSGTYTVNPAKVELMYFPSFYANTDLKKIKL